MWNYLSETVSGAVNVIKNEANKKLMEGSKMLYPPPTTPQFQENGKLSPDQFIAAGDKLTEVCSSWKWKPSINPQYLSKYMDEKKQYLVLENVHCHKRIKSILTESKGEQVVSEDGESVVVLHSTEQGKQQIKKEDYRSYTMYIMYDEYYHTPRMFFSATDFQGKPLVYQQITEDIQKQYLGATLTNEVFPFIENCSMPTVHPCKHANVLKTMSDAMRQNGQKVGAHYALLIFLKFITSVIPTVEFDLTGDLLFE